MLNLTVLTHATQEMRRMFLNLVSAVFSRCIIKYKVVQTPETQTIDTMACRLVLLLAQLTELDGCPGQIHS